MHTSTCRLAKRWALHCTALHCRDVACVDVDARLSSSFVYFRAFEAGHVALIDIIAVCVQR